MSLLKNIGRLVTGAIIGRISPITEKDRDHAFAAIVRNCPICHRSLHHHYHSKLAVLLVGRDEVELAEEAVAKADWRQLLTFNQWDPEADVIQFEAIRCDRHEDLALLRILFTASLWSDDFVQCVQLLSHDDSRRLSALVSNWRPF